MKSLELALIVYGFPSTGDRAGVLPSPSDLREIVIQFIPRSLVLLLVQELYRCLEFLRVGVLVFFDALADIRCKYTTTAYTRRWRQHLLVCYR